jgi:hypothetical protein
MRARGWALAGSLCVACACSSTSRTKTTEADGSASGGAPGDAGADVATDAANEGGAAGGPTRTGLVLWLDAMTGVSSEPNGLVTRWSDQSGNGLDAVQPASGARPILVDVSGLPALVFDGLDDRLNLPTGFADFAAGFSAFVVLGPSRDACQQIIELSSGNELNDISLVIDPPMRFQYEVAVATTLTPDGTFQSGVTTLASVVHTPAARVELRINGELSTTKQAVPLPAVAERATNAVADGEYEMCFGYEGRLFEILVYERALGQDEVAAIEAYLQAKWGCCKL